MPLSPAGQGHALFSGVPDKSLSKCPGSDITFVFGDERGEQELVGRTCRRVRSCVRPLWRAAARRPAVRPDGTRGPAAPRRRGPRSPRAAGTGSGWCPAGWSPCRRRRPRRRRRRRLRRARRSAASSAAPARWSTSAGPGAARPRCRTGWRPACRTGSSRSGRRCRRISLAHGGGSASATRSTASATACSTSPCWIGGGAGSPATGAGPGGVAGLGAAADAGYQGHDGVAEGPAGDGRGAAAVGGAYEV